MRLLFLLLSAQYILASDDNEENTCGKGSDFESSPADYSIVTAKFWFVSDYDGDATADADKYVNYVNEALENSQVPIKYRRWGSVQKLPKTNEEVAMKDEDFNKRFVHALGYSLEDHKRLKQSADHIILLTNKNYGNKAKCQQFSGYRMFRSEVYATVVVAKYVEHYGVVDTDYKPEETFAHEVGHCMQAMHNREVTPNSKNDGIAYGYCLPDADYATIMSYEHTCERSKSKTIPHYSNPDVKYEGHPTGTSEANNAKVMTDYRKGTARLGDNCLDGGLDVDSDKAKNVCKWSSKCWTTWSNCCCKKWYNPGNGKLPPQGDDCYFSTDPKKDSGAMYFSRFKKYKTQREVYKNPLGEVIETRRVDVEVADCAVECGCNYEDKWKYCGYNKRKCDEDGKIWNNECGRTCKC